jgi:alpha-amylase/alpha-mannosidase (GH57 family)
MKALIVHGHFYQPPRENPFTGEVEREPSALPYHDWNERIHSESYGPNAFARLGGDVPEHVVNNYSNISFNFGPTLLSWLQKHQPRTYQRIIDADKESALARGGHGNAIAQAYGHAILPLANERDRLTQVAWGLADFRHHFKREPESMWLPETACNDATLGTLIDFGLRYVVLAPDQAKRVRSSGSDWSYVGGGRVDTTRAYRYSHRDGSGRSLAVFFYNGPLSRAIAFERLLTSSRGLIERFLAEAGSGPLVNVATDGETYGHHFKFGDLCLAHALEVEAEQLGFWVTNYGEFLDRHPPEDQVEIESGTADEGSSWSCAHGVGRWSRDCGCHTGGEPGWNQSWRGPLLAALRFLRDQAASDFENAASEYFRNPWAARNAYVKLVLDPQAAADFFREVSKRPLAEFEQERALGLLELQRNALLMFTSCGWFFSDLAGIETVQVMRYAARVIELQEQLGLRNVRKEFLQMMAIARGNRNELGTGADIYTRLADRASQRFETAAIPM